MTVSVSDSFNRADSATGLGTTDSYNGGTTATWSNIIGIMGINSNQAYDVNGITDTFAVVNGGQSDVSVSVTIPADNNRIAGIYLRSTDANNWIRIVRVTNAIYIQKKVSGTQTTLLNKPTTLANNDILNVQANGSTISVYNNGTLIGTVTETFNQTVTNHGVGVQGSTSYTSVRFDNFQIEDLNTGGTGTIAISSTVKSNTSSFSNLIGGTHLMTANTVKSNTTSLVAVLKKAVASSSTVTSHSSATNTANVSRSVGSIVKSNSAETTTLSVSGTTVVPVSSTVKSNSSVNSLVGLVTRRLLVTVKSNSNQTGIIRNSIQVSSTATSHSNQQVIVTITAPNFQVYLRSLKRSNSFAKPVPIGVVRKLNALNKSITRASATLFKLTAVNNMIEIIRFKRGQKNNLPSLQVGEPAVTTDTNEMYVGMANGNVKVPTQPDLDSINSSLAQKAQQTDLDKANTKINILPTTIHNSDGIVDRLVSIAQTYVDNVGLFAYGNSGTAYSPSLVIDSNGKYQMDCSSFANLMIHGVPFQNSKYNSNANNIINPLFFQGVDGFTYRLANQLAQYASDNGYAFTPNSDYSNIEPGDVLFFSWNFFDSNDYYVTPDEQSFHNSAFMKIDHVAIALDKKNDGYWNTLQFNQKLQIYYPCSNSYMSQCVLVARFPFANVETMYSGDNLLINGDTVNNGVSAVPYTLARPLVKGQYYSLLVNANSITSGQRLIIQTATYQTIFDDTGRTTPYNGITEIRFPYLLDEVTYLLRVAITGTSPTGNFTWSQLYSGYKRNKVNYIKNTSNTYVKDFALDPTLVSDLNSGLAPYYKYSIDRNEININFNLPFNTLRSGSLTLGNMPSGDYPTTTQRIPANLVGTSGEAVNAVLQISSSGVVSVIPYSPYSSTSTWRYVTANGKIFK